MQFASELLQENCIIGKQSREAKRKINSEVLMICLVTSLG